MSLRVQYHQACLLWHVPNADDIVLRGGNKSVFLLVNAHINDRVVVSFQKARCFRNLKCSRGDVEHADNTINTTRHQSITTRRKCKRFDAFTNTDVVFVWLQLGMRNW